jgi:hypothetical protein
LAEKIIAPSREAEYLDILGANYFRREPKLSEAMPGFRNMPE